MYNLAIYLYLFAAKIVACWNKKVRLMIQGHSQTFETLRTQIDKGSRYLWFHAASLGEFEQGRPLIERIRESHPEYKILLTFFSPSGYEVRKNYEGADVVCYLPFDTPRNVHRFFKLVHPEMAFFIKYEFWQNYLNKLQQLNIPTYSVSSIFRPNQLFFRWYGGQYYKVLTHFTHLFVQNEPSRQLLAARGITNVSVVGDTRFDRVLDIFQQAKQLSLVENFKGSSFVLVAGSSWSPDEDIFIPYFNDHPEMKLIIAPHVISDTHLKEIIEKLKRPYVLYTQADAASIAQADCLIVNCYGLLSSIYRYGEVAYVGGGFGVGIHNLLEAVVYDVPVLFGPNNERFREATDLKTCEGGVEITKHEDFTRFLDLMMINETHRKELGKRAGDYVRNNAGATQAILNFLGLY